MTIQGLAVGCCLLTASHAAGGHHILSLGRVGLPGSTAPTSIKLSNAGTTVVGLLLHAGLGQGGLVEVTVGERWELAAELGESVFALLVALLGLTLLAGCHSLADENGLFGHTLLVLLHVVQGNLVA